MLFFWCYKGKCVLFIIGVYVSNSAISCLTCILKIKAYLLLQQYQLGIWPNIFIDCVNIQFSKFSLFFLH